MLRFKSDVRFVGVQTPIVFAIFIAEQVFDAHGVDCWITSLTDGDHRANSHHHSGNGADIRSQHLDSETKALVYAELKSRLSPTFRVLLESEGEPNEHFHIEVQT